MDQASEGVNEKLRSDSRRVHRQMGGHGGLTRWMAGIISCEKETCRNEGAGLESDKQYIACPQNCKWFPKILRD